MTCPPGSFFWLLCHDLRLNWRQFTDVFAGWSARKAAVAVVGGLIVMHALAWAALAMRALSPGLAGPGVLAASASGALLWMIAQGLMGATRSLYERGDLDVLFASPLTAWKAVASRALSIAAASLAALAPMMFPLAHVGAWIDGPSWLSMYPILIAMALFGTAIGFMLGLALFAAVGPKQARQFSQILAAGIAGAFVLAVQIGFLLPKSFADDVANWFGQIQRTLGWNGGAWLAHLEASMRGDMATLAVMLAVSVGVFALAVGALSEAFARATQTAAGTTADVATARTIAGSFRAGAFPALRLKEWRLLVRDPNLFAQLGLQIVYTLPLAVLLLRGPNDIPPAVGLAPLIVVLAAQIAASLAWIAVSGEDAPEMMATAPVPARQAARAKLSAVAAPLAVILALPVLALAVISLKAALYAIVFGGLAACSTALLNLWHPMSGNRRSLLRRHSQSKVIAMAEHGMAVLWALAVVVGMVNLWLALVPAGVIIGVLWMFAPKSSITAGRSAWRGRLTAVALQHN